MKRFYYIFCIFLAWSCGSFNEVKEPNKEEEQEIALLLNRWHKAAADVNYRLYFELMANESVFIGTDPTENWDKKEFMEWSKPYFDNGTAWSFTSLERNIYFNEGKKIAWFDELLETQMGVCRGSGIVQEIGGEWKIKHYVLSLTVPNENVDAVTELKEKFDKAFIVQIKKKLPKKEAF